jgi:hypothetical protein
MAPMTLTRHARGANPPGVRSALLPVALDRRLRPDLGTFGVEAGGTARPALPEQVPALVQADRELTQALTVLAGESLLANVALFQPVLLGQEPLDLGQHVSVVHGLSLCRRHTMLAPGEVEHEQGYRGLLGNAAKVANNASTNLG